MKRKKPPVTSPGPPPSTVPAYPDHRRDPWFYAMLALTFLFSMTIYLLTLAPTVTFEDSGEFIAAAYHLGVPHQPGYPLFTLLGRVFSLLPLSEVAYRLNLMSAVLASLGAVCISWTVLLLIEEIFPPAPASPPLGSPDAPRLPLAAYAAALAAGILMASAFENWEQSIITEVYGLNTFFVGAILLLTAYWHRQTAPEERMRYFVLICYAIGLTLSNHTTSLMFIPVLFGFGLIADRAFFLRLRHILLGLGALLAGLLPYLYLPLASRRDPLMDWGNPETLTNFLRTVARHQYNLDDPQTLAKFSAQIGAYGDLLLSQWFPAFLLLALIGLGALWRRQRHYFWLSLLFLAFAMPITTYMTNFDVSAADPFVAAEHRALVSVFYIPSYIYLALLMGIGIYALAQWHWRRRPRYWIEAVALLAVLLPAALAYRNYQQVDKSRYYFARDYVENLFRMAEPNALVWANWDPYYFPTNYIQLVEGQRPDVLVLDQQLLRRSWYIRWLRDHHPEFMEKVAGPVDEFLEAVAPFENRQSFDGNFIQMRYIAMINAMIDAAMGEGRAVYFTYPPPPGVAARYFREPLPVAWELKQPGEPLTPVTLTDLKFRGFFRQDIPLDRMAKVFRNYYGGLMFNRAIMLEKIGDKVEAKRYYLEARKFLSDQPRMRQQIDAALERLE